MNYSVTNCNVRSYEEGVILTVRNAGGYMLGDIACTPRKKIDKVFLIQVVKNLLKADETFDMLMHKAILELKPYVETIDIKLVF